MASRVANQQSPAMRGDSDLPLPPLLPRLVLLPMCVEAGPEVKPAADCIPFGQAENGGATTVCPLQLRVGSSGCNRTSSLGYSSSLRSLYIIREGRNTMAVVVFLTSEYSILRRVNALSVRLCLAS